MTRSKTTLAAMSIALVAALTACSSDDTTTGPTSTGSGGQGTGAASSSTGSPGAGGEGTGAGGTGQGGTAGFGGGGPCVDDIDLPLLMVAPENLSETGLFDPNTTMVAPYIASFEPEYKLWSDGATKLRYAYLPKCTQIETSDMDHWDMPVGARFWKEFTRDGIRIETRLIHRFGPGKNDWLFATYHWETPDATDAVHVPMGVMNANGTNHDIPAEGMCIQCHGKLDERVLGFSAIQLSHAGPGETMTTLSNDGRLTVPNPDGFKVPGDSVAQAALGYLHANCGNCHNETGVQNVDIWLRLLVTDMTVQDADAYSTTVGKPTTNFLCSGCNRIEAGDPAASAIIQRMSVRGTTAQMPPIATEVVDDVGVAAVSAWIASMPACSSEGEACNGTISCCGGSCVAGTCVDSCTTVGVACAANTDCCTGVCGMANVRACSGDYQPCATNNDCCNMNCDTTSGMCI